MGLRETKIEPGTISAVSSYSQRSPQILGIFGTQFSERELCPRAKWRRGRYWRRTLSACKSLILLSSNFDRVRILRADPRCFSEVLFLLIPWITRPPLASQFRRSSFHSPRHHRNLTRCHAAAPLPEPASGQCPGRLGSFTAVSAGSGSAPPAPCLRHPAAARWYGRYRLLSRSAG